MSEIRFKVTVRRDMVADELMECADDTRQLIELIPDYSRPEAIKIAKRIEKRMKGWITTDLG